MLHRGRVHEVSGARGAELALSVAGTCRRSVFWVSDGRYGVLRRSGVAAYARADRIICVRVASRDEALWAAEQALRCAGADLVVAEMRRGPDLFESRRLQIAAQAGGGVGFVLIRGEVQSSAAQTRWHCEVAVEPGQDWVWRLTKNKQGLPGAWSVRGDPDPRLTHPPDLLPAGSLLAGRLPTGLPPADTSSADTSPADPSNALTLTTTACPAPAAAAAGSLAPA